MLDIVELEGIDGTREEKTLGSYHPGAVDDAFNDWWNRCSL